MWSIFHLWLLVKILTVSIIIFLPNIVTYFIERLSLRVFIFLQMDVSISSMTFLLQMVTPFGEILQETSRTKTPVGPRVSLLTLSTSNKKGLHSKSIQ